MTSAFSPAWQNAVAAVVDGDGKVHGTAFFVGSDMAFTCVHVLKAAEKKPIKLVSLGGQTDPVVDIDSDEDLDLALVRTRSQPDRKWLVLSDKKADLNREVFSKGFPRDRPISKYPDGFPIGPSRIAGETTLDWRGRRVSLLVLGASVVPGMSGAPAVYNDAETVIGILRIRSGETNVYATPAEAARERWPKLPTSAAADAPSFAEIVPAMPWSLASTGWTEFDPELLHCAVVDSESLATGDASGHLTSLATEVFSSPGVRALWQKFRWAQQGRELLDRRPRDIAEAYDNAHVRQASFNINDAFASPASLHRAIQMIVQADLALFDVTGFEPGVMLLLGIRAASRRGVTVNSHGGGWREGFPLDRPFNLSDLSLSSHTPPDEAFVGDDPRIDRFIERVCEGFDQLARQPHYLDLPVYDALRQLGSQEDAWASIPIAELVLVLCSYGHEYFPRWQSLRRRLKYDLAAKGVVTNVARLQDLPSPQLVSQSLYERVRRCNGCIADWTKASPSTFFELGVRLAVSRSDVVQIIDSAWLQEVTEQTDSQAHYVGQLTRMLALLTPLTYQGPSDVEVCAAITQRLLEIRTDVEQSGGHRIRAITADALGKVEQRLPHMSEQLINEANALDHKNRERDQVSQVLFDEIVEIKQDYERSALERRLAAWLYLEHRVGAGDLEDADSRKQVWRELGTIVAGGLYLSDDDADLTLADYITERLT